MFKSTEEMYSEIIWNNQGLIPAVVQEIHSREVLMLAWMNRESLGLTIRENRGVYWSRSRQSIWRKGETSGHIQKLRSLHLDCDKDSLLLTVEQTGAACHTGNRHCFMYQVDSDGYRLDQSTERMTLDRLYHTICSRRDAHPDTSYTASLFAGGADKLVQKLGEESIELIIEAGKMMHDADAVTRAAFVAEAADLLYHYLVVLARFDVTLEDVVNELSARSGQSGIEEKKLRESI